MTQTKHDLLQNLDKITNELAILTGVRGMDALIVQTAKENGSLLVSLDNERLKLVKGKVSIKNPENLI
ncbi:hypothetical protein A2526_01625 [candidate division WOR-1 bacterium RIFOXYD2_FULL_36_8]|uniref:PIN domain-containing protein n=1 Tax=candidate division WOR-1 bacterium RIFOXYB2_FULL_36_35 TaxID=1802578 RepID=A0A1F4S8W8_UNCSA|nr:MAG: hypothetical protein A2230_05720 [candidate division WOR-1 bacterium RIFOXYA2_FULL_36_21]OGC16854.1 MAG: hypothetical protein A2290_05005 [candidate division WOR-1 bacterium RIFOXYB2_FULL_36_35]OGC18679.1 MAG: hypothetical protein A2282_07205 [candidate division WOR-1 bacterium RIFOXYA12_FULL_36_13]OGC41626.1 MAG: hypothetical protein A2526_01625 [candidate division WOR-1 bacterium RIFOXYD2_FULL_36_8]